MIRYRPHKLSGSREFQSGIPGDWPQVEEEVRDDRRLSPEEVAEGFSLITPEEHQQIRTLNRAAYNAWLVDQKAVEDSDLTTKRTDLSDALAQLILLRDSPGDLTLRQLSNGARLIAKVLVWLIQRGKEIFER